jgi:hypothetical protein
MIGVTTVPRFVVVLGRSTENLGDPQALVQGALEHQLDVAVFSIGFPVTPQQQAFVAESVELAVEAGIHLDAEILGTTSDLADRFTERDDVVLASRGLERRRIEGILRKVRTARAG